MTIHSGHRQRLIEEYLSGGLEEFPPHKILELLLFFAIPRKDTNEIAHRLIQTFGSLSGVLEAPYEQLIAVEGVGHNTAVFLTMMPDLSRVYWRDSLARAPLHSSRDAGTYLMTHFAGLREEHVGLICLDAKNRIVSSRLFQEGSFNAADVNIRRILGAALQNNAVSVILAHNHPGGVALPSETDLETTQRLREALEPAGVTLRDHIILADGDYVSLADTGVL